MAAEYDVFIRFFTESLSEEDAKKVAQSISDLVYRQLGIDSVIDEISESD